MPPKILYHVTDSKNVAKIKKLGLKPKKDYHLDDTVVNLATKCVVGTFASWLVQGDWIDNPIILKVDTEGLRLKEIGSGQGWYVSKAKIPATRIEVTGLDWHKLKCRKHG